MRNSQRGQILASSMVSGLLAGRQSFTFRDHGTIELNGLGPFAASEVIYEHDDPSVLCSIRRLSGARRN